MPAWSNRYESFQLRIIPSKPWSLVQIIYIELRELSPPAKCCVSAVSMGLTRLSDSFFFIPCLLALRHFFHYAIVSSGIALSSSRSVQILPCFILSLWTAASHSISSPPFSSRHRFISVSLPLISSRRLLPASTELLKIVSSGFLLSLLSCLYYIQAVPFCQ